MRGEAEAPRQRHRERVASLIVRVEAFTATAICIHHFIQFQGGGNPAAHAPRILGRRCGAAPTPQPHPYRLACALTAAIVTHVYITPQQHTPLPSTLLLTQLPTLSSWSEKSSISNSSTATTHRSEAQPKQRTREDGGGRRHASSQSKHTFLASGGGDEVRRRTEEPDRVRGAATHLDRHSLASIRRKDKRQPSETPDHEEGHKA